jgi:hypothetical protein
MEILYTKDDYAEMNVSASVTGAEVNIRFGVSERNVDRILSALFRGEKWSIVILDDEDLTNTEP